MQNCLKISYFAAFLKFLSQLLQKVPNFSSFSFLTSMIFLTPLKSSEKPL